MGRLRRRATRIFAGFAVPAASYIDLVRPPDQIGDDRSNVVFYSLRRVTELLAQANPNILELLFMPPDCMLRTSPEMEALVSHSHLFVSKQCADTHAGYAMSQIRKARGKNKWVNNPKPPSALRTSGNNDAGTLPLLRAMPNNC